MTTPSSSSSSLPFLLSVSSTLDGGNIEYVGMKIISEKEQLIAEEEDVHNRINEDEEQQQKQEVVEQVIKGDDQKKTVVAVQVYLRIRPDVYTELEQLYHMQYFYFRVTIHPHHSTTKSSSSSSSNPSKANFINRNTTEFHITYMIENANEVSYPIAWQGSTICYSYEFDNITSWLRNSTTQYQDGKLKWTHIHQNIPQQNPIIIYFAYFPPYTYERHLRLVSYCTTYATKQQQQASISYLIPHVISLGQTIEGREIDCIRIGNGKYIVWIICRQHPGETMAEYYAEGLIERLLLLKQQQEEQEVDPNQPDQNNNNTEQVHRILNIMYTIYIVPCMCLDGAVHGYLRTNAKGANLNREWATKGNYIAPTIERSPEVYYAFQMMKQTGCDLFLDIHGDEELPYNFISGAEYVPNWSPRLQSLHGAFVAAYSRSNSDMQRMIGYPPMSSSEAVLEYMNVATNQICYQFNCLAMTLEMPFKDCQSNPDPERGWTPIRAKALGASVLDPMEYIFPYLRTNDSDLWIHQLPKEDEYIEPHDDYEGFKPLQKRYYSDVRDIYQK